MNIRKVIAVCIWVLTSAFLSFGIYSYTKDLVDVLSE